MYTEFFGLKEKPFNLTPDPSYVYLSENHQKAKVMLEYGLSSHAGFTVITGDIGVGKTTMVYHELSKLGGDVVLGVVNNTHDAFGNLLCWVMSAFDLDVGDEADNISNTKRFRQFTEFVIRQREEGRRVLLVVDEAQNLSMSSLEELRLISNINIDGYVALQVILVGQLELLERLNSPSLVQFAQRIGVEYNLKAMGFDDTCNYIRHRLQVAGAAYEVFCEKAMAAVYCFSEGIPRRINTLCDMALVYAFAEGKKQVDLLTVMSVVQDRRSAAVIKPTKTDNEEIKNMILWLEKELADELNRLNPDSVL